MSWFKRKAAREVIIPPDAQRATEEAARAKHDAYSRTEEVNALADSLRTLHKENHLAEAIISSMAVRPTRRRRRIWT